MKIFKRFSHIAVTAALVLSVVSASAMDISVRGEERRDTCAMIEQHIVGFYPIRTAAELKDMIDEEAERINDRHPYQTRAKRNIGEMLCQEFMEQTGSYLSWGNFLRRRLACCQEAAKRNVKDRRLFEMQHNPSNNGVDHFIIPVKKGTTQLTESRLILFTEAKYRATGAYEPGEPAAGCQGSGSWIADALREKAKDYDAIAKNANQAAHSLAKYEKFLEDAKHEQDVACCARAAAKNLRTLKKGCHDCTVVSTATVVDEDGILKMILLTPKGKGAAPGLSVAQAKNRFTRSLPHMFSTKDEALAAQRFRGEPVVVTAHRRRPSVYPPCSVSHLSDAFRRQASLSDVRGPW